MPSKSVQPASIRISASPGGAGTITQDFLVPDPPTGALTATVTGDPAIFRLHSFSTSRTEKRRLTDEEFAQLPLHLRDEEHRFAVEVIDVDTVGAGMPLPVNPGLIVRGIVEFNVPARGVGPSFHAGTLVIDGLDADRDEVPLLLVGEIRIEFPAGPIVIHEGQWTPIPVRVTLTGAPDTDITLESTGGPLRVPLTHVRVPSGQSADAVLMMVVHGRGAVGQLDTLLQVGGHSQKFNFVPMTAEIRPPLPIPPSPGEQLAQASAAIRDFHEMSSGILVVGSPVGPTRHLPGDRFEQQYTFGSIIKHLDSAPAFASRWVVTIKIAAIKCFGTDDPGGTDEPYIVVATYAMDPFGKNSVQTREIHFGERQGGEIFGVGEPITLAPIFIPGDGSVQVNISLWEEEMARPSVLQDKWRDIATTAIIGGLTMLHPAIGAAATTLEASKKVISDTSRELIIAVSDFLGLSDDHLATHGFTITSDFLRRLKESDSALVRSSPSIGSIKYNFPEFTETPDAEGRSWLFEGGGGSYRIFLVIRTDDITLTQDL